MMYQGTIRKERQTRALDVLDRVGLSHRSHSMPSTLSGGERQRAAIARALVADPSVLLCDEPTGNLDQGSAGVVMDLLGTLNAEADLTVIVVTHDPSVAFRANRHLTVSDGVVSE
jgi:putative ABC transport system ATP-binding protein